MVAFNGHERVPLSCAVVHHHSCIALCSPSFLPFVEGCWYPLPILLFYFYSMVFLLLTGMFSLFLSLCVSLYLSTKGHLSVPMLKIVTLGVFGEFTFSPSILFFPVTHSSVVSLHTVANICHCVTTALELSTI